MRPAAIRAARCTAALRERLSRRAVPTIYANDHYGHWHESFPDLVRRCQAPGSAGRPLVEALPPRKGDYVVLKPRHSAFFGTPLEFLLDELNVTRLVVTGLATDICVLFSAEDAYMRKFRLWIPSDCVAAQTAARTRNALRHAAEVLGADIAPSASS
jgi:nicotinamidase-related amidase